MTENNNQNDQPAEEQSSDETQAEYREISEEELEQILEDHKKWLESDGKEGKRADLSKANLSHATSQNPILRGANLRRADLTEANLKNADLREANLEMAKLYNANLRKAFLDKSILELGSDRANQMIFKTLC
jgi:hypothetical protein